MEWKKQRGGRSGLFGRRTEEEPRPPAEAPSPPEESPSPPPEVPPPLPPEHPVRRLLERWDPSALPLMPEPPGADGMETDRFQRALLQCCQARLERMEDAERDGAADMDAEYLVHVAADRMTAWALVLPAEGAGAPAAMESLLEALARAGVRAGLDQGELEGCLAPPWCVPRVAARGTPARDGADGRVAELVPRQPEGLRESDPTGAVDYRSKSCVTNITAGEVLCDIFPPEPGEAGFRVDDTPLPARPGKPAKAPMGTNTQLTEDGAHLVATLDGHVLFSGGSFQVKPLLDIPGDVDYSTGNVDFRGDVHIAGDVRVNFSVKATGSITVDGLVEAANVEAEGDVIVTKGVLGERRAVIKAGRTVRVRYLENCTVYAGEGIYADCIISCEAFSDGRICTRSGRGAIIGGRLTAGELVDAVSLGTQSERKTEVILGVLPYAGEELRRCGEELAGVHAELLALDRESGRSPENAAKNRLRHSVLAMKEERLIKRRAELEGRRAALTQCRLQAGALYPGVELTIGHAWIRFEHEHRLCAARYDEKEAQIVVS